MPPAHPHVAFHDAFYQDRIVLFGGSSRTLHLLQLALIRSDNVLLVDARHDDALSLYVQRMRVERRRDPVGNEFKGALTVLVADGRADVEDAIVEDARFHCIPVYVSGRPYVSDFTLLDFVERRSITLASRSPSSQRAP